MGTLVQFPMQTLQRLFGLPCWNARVGYASFLMFEFGRPSLEILEPHKLVRPTSPRSREFWSRRHVHVNGTWHLRIDTCAWTIYQRKRTPVSSESPRRQMERAMSFLDGQALRAVTIDARRGRTRFDFDCGGRIVTRRFDEDGEQWTLRVPGGRWFGVTADGRYSIHSGNWTPDRMEWAPMPQRVIRIRAPER